MPKSSIQRPAFPEAPVFPPSPVTNGEGEPRIKAVDFKVIHFLDKHAPANDGGKGREIILVYSLGEDGVIREFSNGKWVPFPIT
jgi:hypothetical protein